MGRCSDGGEDQGAEEAFMGQKKEESSRQFWKEPSPVRAALPFQRGYFISEGGIHAYPFALI